VNASILLLGALIAFTIAYRFYGSLLTKLFGVDSSRLTPAHTKRDGIDYEPAKNWWVLFGHHFSSICGAGPIVGPVLAVAWWGWMPSVIWLIIGAIWMGAVSDFSSLFVSMRHEGQSIARIAEPEISRKGQLLFSVFIWISLILVIAVFSIFAAKTFVAEPQSVVPSFGLIPVAVLTGYLLYKTRTNNAVATTLGLALLIALLFLGHQSPFSLPDLFGLTTENAWIIILLIYCFIASITPVQILLQPRDYLASFLLFAVIFLGIACVFIQQPQISTPAFIAFQPDAWPNAGPLWPMLFVTIACGAISGFHSLVSSGTTCKQISSEGHACRIGYGGMLVECLVGVLVLICVTTSLNNTDITNILKTDGPIGVFGQGYGKLSQTFLGPYGITFAILALNAFILTTLDSATRITRYLTTELFGINNKYIATLLVVIAAGALAMTGQWQRLWPAFGTANQLIAGITLLVASCWLLNRGKRIRYTLIPSILMLVTTIGAFIWQLWSSLHEAKPDYIIAGICLGLIILALVICADAFKVLSGQRKQENSLI